MAKILLVEDDNNLREIYEARLMAEGYDIVSARDGEEALSVAIKEKPDLIISDVMMPKISGFDMLDILRTTEETKNVKVIMMTALSQAEDKARAEKLGADRYLVKSQVTLEDVAKVAKDVLDGASNAPTTPAPVATATQAPESTPAEASTPPSAPTDTAQQVTSPVPQPEPVIPVASTPADDTAGQSAMPAAPVQTPPATTEPQATPLSEPTQADPVTVAPTATEPVASSASPSTEAEDEQEVQEATPAPAQTTIDAEEKAIAQQLEQIISQSVETAQTEQTTVAAPTLPEAPSVPASPEPVVATPVSEPAASDESIKTARKVIEPLNNINEDMKPKLEALAAAEEQKEAAQQAAASPAPVVGDSTVSSSAAPQVSNEPVVAAPATPDMSLPKPEPTTTDEKIDPNLIAL
jgi:CheY-like chemotaxis protein